MRNEFLKQIAAKFLDVCISVLNKAGGDLVYFCGRSCIALFPHMSGTQTDLRELTQRAVSCALDVAKECEKFLETRLEGD